MARIRVDVTQLASLATFERTLVRFVRIVGFLGLIGAAAVAALLARDGYSVADGILTILLLPPPAILLLFAQGLHELLSLPQRVRRMPGEGQERIAELTRVAGQARTTTLRGLPLVLWRLRRVVGSIRDVAGVAVSLRVLTPSSLGLALLAALACVLLAGVGVIALVVLAVA